jgi:electron transfer flavoprotein beta subunit
VGSFIAELLNIPQVSDIVRLNISAQERQATVERYLGKGDREELECSLPALFSVELALNDPRYPTLPHKLAAAVAPVEIISTESLGINRESEKAMTKIAKISLPRPKTRKVFTPDSSLSAEDRLRQMMVGGNAKAKEAGDTLEGTPAELAEHIVKFLKQEKIL